MSRSTVTKRNHKCDPLCKKENYENYYNIIYQDDLGWIFKTGSEGHIIFFCPFCGDEL